MIGTGKRETETKEYEIKSHACQQKNETFEEKAV